MKDRTPVFGELPLGQQNFLLRKEERQTALSRLLLDKLPDGEAIHLEIGCGHGHFLTAYASQHPDQLCLGIDISSRRIRLATEKCAKRNLPRLIFLKAEVAELLNVLPERTRMGRIFMLFPDPWPKKRHIKNRMLQQSLLAICHGRSLPGTYFYFRSDHPVMVNWAYEQFNQTPYWEIREDGNWPFEEESYFQQLASTYTSIIARRCG